MPIAVGKMVHIILYISCGSICVRDRSGTTDDRKEYNG